MTTPAPHRPDLTLVLSADGIIQEATTGASLADEACDAWIGQSWESTVGEVGPTKVRRLLQTAKDQRVSGFSQINQLLPSGRELLMEFSAVYPGDSDRNIVAIGKNLGLVVEQQQKLLAAQHAIEREYWKLRDIESRYKAVIGSTREAVVLVREHDLSVVEANARARRLLNLPPVNRHNNVLDLGAETDRIRNVLRETHRSGTAPSTLVHLGNGRASWRVKATAIRGMQEQHCLLQFSRFGDRTFSTLTAPGRDRATAALAIVDAAGRVLLANASFAELTGSENAAELCGRPIATWLPTLSLTDRDAKPQLIDFGAPTGSPDQNAWPMQVILLELDGEDEGFVAVMIDVLQPNPEAL